MKCPLVSVILTHQLECNIPYLRLALWSLMNSRGIDFEVFLVSGQKGKIPDDMMIRNMPENFTLIWDQNLDTATKKINYVLPDLSSHSTHLMLLSDDVILSASCISRMHKAFFGREMIMGPMSNSDLNTRYDASMELMAGKLVLRPDMDLPDLKNHQIDELVRLNVSDYLGRLLIPFPWISFFCVMMPKTVWAKVGGLDPKLEYRHNDQDFCGRAYQMQIPTVVNFATFAFHFGSRTLSQLKTPEIDQEATQHYLKKWEK